MNQSLIFLAGLAIMTLSCSPPSLANSSPTHPSPWNLPEDINAASASPLPANSIPSSNLNSQLNSQPKIHSNIQSGVQADIQPNIQSNIKDSQNRPDALTSPPAAVLADSPPAFREAPNTHQGYIPLTPANAAPSASSTSQSAIPIPSDLGLQFDLSNSTPSQPTVQPPVKPPPAAVPPLLPPASASVKPASPLQPNPSLPTTPASQPTDFTLGDLFAGGSDSLVAIVVGNAEGTRSPDGQPNQHFHGHTDPGNGVWNLGTFSYQHGAASPEEADMKQLKRLKQQAQVIQQKAAASGLKLTLLETLNGIDLANQAPKAVIDGEGYVEWLVKAYQMGKSGSDAILWARVQSFIDPKTQRWDAPGLGNTVDSITHDQQRRMQAIERAITAQNYQIASDARLRSQPIGFRLPRWNFASRMLQKVATLLN